MVPGKCTCFMSLKQEDEQRKIFLISYLKFYLLLKNCILRLLNFSGNTL